MRNPWDGTHPMGYYNTGVFIAHYLDLSELQIAFNKATIGVVTQNKCSYSGQLKFDSSISYGLSTEIKDPIGHLLTNEQVSKYSITDSKLLCGFPDELIKELIPNSGVVCARRFLHKLQRAHSLAFMSLKKTNTEQEFIPNYIVNSNVVAKYFGLIGIYKDYRLPANKKFWTDEHRDSLRSLLQFIETQ